MSFQICPDDGYPRIWRYVSAGTLPDGMIAKLYRDSNILMIDRQQFERLQPMEQHQLLRTDSDWWEPRKCAERVIPPAAE